MPKQVFSETLLMKLALNGKAEGLRLVHEEKRPDKGEDVTEAIFEFEGKLFSMLYKDVYWRTHNVAILDASGGDVECAEVKAVKETASVTKYKAV
ncbi:hypothetical protein F2P58_23345 [Vibrio fortis]|uniref:Uncharacterized protein n=1 Tax=Vibrio fortis TaxID=212667 RepID=A0A5N3QUW3_9VIBR|nr:hypothetical protein [Vibrio fortis]KAB0285452.1 hypothetical protein F2P58_23345 [Vibrio fortis]